EGAVRIARSPVDETSEPIGISIYTEITAGQLLVLEARRGPMFSSIRSAIVARIEVGGDSQNSPDPFRKAEAAQSFSFTLGLTTQRKRFCFDLAGAAGLVKVSLTT